GIMPHAKVMKAIELYGTKVAPVVRKETAKSLPAATAPVV
ncbi:LLM class flavin-dependent oxidoreductase, partial [Mesorhizobium helmanticense]